MLLLLEVCKTRDHMVTLPVVLRVHCVHMWSVSRVYVNAVLYAVVLVQRSVSGVCNVASVLIREADILHV